MNVVDHCILAIDLVILNYIYLGYLYCKVRESICFMIRVLYK